MLTSCDYRDNFPPPMFAYFKPAARIPGAFKVLMAPMRLRAPRRLPFAFGWLVKRPIDREAEDSYVLAGMAVPGVAEDVKRVIKGLDKRYTNEAADRLGEFTKPALVAWSREDRFFKPAHGEQLARDLGNARLEWIDDARTFASEDQPGRLAELIAGFVREPVRAGLAEPLDDHGLALAAGHAHGLEADRLVVGLEAVQQRGHDARAGHPERVARARSPRRAG